tara:strand:+ start:5676 stop:7406 length:1731 start_codon:yes stop_codon:yes gene_type:complete
MMTGNRPPQSSCVQTFKASLAVLLLLSTTGCKEETNKTRPVVRGKDNSPARFLEKSAEAGITFQHTDGSTGEYYIVETLASGVGLIDFNNDGHLDIYFLNGCPLPPPEDLASCPPNALYRNRGDGTFEDVTREKGLEARGFSIGCGAGDYDSDGDLDIYVAGFGRNHLYRNNGAKEGFSFTEVTSEAGVDDPRFSAGACFLDYDRDGHLDLYVSNYCEVNFASSKPCFNNNAPGYCAPGQYTPVHDSLFRNNGDGTFEDVSQRSGIARDPEPGPKWGMGIAVCDFNNDGWPDIYLANDVSDNFLFENQKDGTFKNIATEAMAAVGLDGAEQGSMGVDAGDFDGDGSFDLIVTNYHKQLNALYHNEGKFGFSDQALSRGLGDSTLPMVSWGTRLLDYDNDGQLDLFIANGHLEDQIDRYDQSSEYRQRNQLYRGENKRFTEITKGGGSGLKEKLSSRGAAFGDIDNDGDIDIVICNSRERPSLLINETPNKNTWLSLKLKGKKDPYALGARASVTAAGRTQVAEVRSGGSYVCQNDLRLHFGLADSKKAEKVIIRWPGGNSSTFENLEANREHLLEE